MAQTTRAYRMRRFACLVLILLAGAGPGLGGDEMFNVDFFPGWDGYYRPMQWSPVEIGITTELTSPFAGTFTVSAQQDGLNTLDVTHDIVLTPDMPLHLPLVTKFAYQVSTCELRIRDERGRTRWRQDVDVMDFSADEGLLRTVEENQLLIGVIGQSRFGLLNLPQQAKCLTRQGLGEVRIGGKVARMAPWDWTGYVSLDVLILYDIDWTSLNDHQGKAIADWVHNGGTLLIVLGQHPLVKDHPLSEVLPFDLDQPKNTRLDAGALEALHLRGDVPERVVAWGIRPREQAIVFADIATADDRRVAGAAYAGFGQVGVLGFDPFDLSDAQQPRSADFWVGLVSTLLEDAAHPQSDPSPPSAQPGTARTPVLGRTITMARDPSGPTGGRPGPYQVGVSQRANNEVMAHLYDIPQMQPLSIWWVILTLTAMAILLGPVDYLVLKRLDRLPLTWLTSMGWIVLFTVGAYYGVRALRGGTMQLRVVSVVDGISDSDCVWSTRYAGLFAPRSDNYRFDPLGAKQWWSGIAPSRDVLWSQQRYAGLRRVSCQQHDGANVPTGVPISIWTIQCLLQESPVESMPLAATVQTAGDKVSVEIRNQSGSTLTRGYVLLENGYIEIGSISPGATRRFDGLLRPRSIWAQHQRVPRDGGGQRSGSQGEYADFASVDFPPIPHGVAFFAQGCMQRTETIAKYLARGAAMVCATFDNPNVPFDVSHRSRSRNHVELARLVIMPQRGQ